jgi:hypothetical protein
MQWPTPPCRRSVSMRMFGKSGRPMASTAGVTSPAAGFAGADQDRMVFLRHCLLLKFIRNDGAPEDG